VEDMGAFVDVVSGGSGKTDDAVACCWIGVDVGVSSATIEATLRLFSFAIEAKRV
jgi:hypothetical protein